MFWKSPCFTNESSPCFTNESSPCFTNESSPCFTNESSPCFTNESSPCFTNESSPCFTNESSPCFTNESSPCFTKWVQSVFYKWVQSRFYKSSPVHVLQHADYESFPCCFLDKHGCYVMCQKTVVLIKLQKVNKSDKRRMQDSKCFYSNFWSNFSNFPYNLYFG